MFFCDFFLSFRFFIFRSYLLVRLQLSNITLFDCQLLVLHDEKGSTAASSVSIQRQLTVLNISNDRNLCWDVCLPSIQLQCIHSPVSIAAAPFWVGMGDDSDPFPVQKHLHRGRDGRGCHQLQTCGDRADLLDVLCSLFFTFQPQIGQSILERRSWRPNRNVCHKCQVFDKSLFCFFFFNFLNFLNFFFLGWTKIIISLTNKQLQFQTNNYNSKQTTTISKQTTAIPNKQLQFPIEHSEGKNNNERVNVCFGDGKLGRISIWSCKSRSCTSFE